MRKGDRKPCSQRAALAARAGDAAEIAPIMRGAVARRAGKAGEPSA